MDAGLGSAETVRGIEMSRGTKSRMTILSSVIVAPFAASPGADSCSNRSYTPNLVCRNYRVPLLLNILRHEG